MDSLCLLRGIHQISRTQREGVRSPKMFGSAEMGSHMWLSIYTLFDCFLMGGETCESSSTCRRADDEYITNTLPREKSDLQSPTTSCFTHAETMRTPFSVLLAAALLPSLVCADVFSLSNLSWSLSNENGSIVVPGSLPSQVHLDLMSADIITEPLLGINGRLCVLLSELVFLIQDSARFYSEMDCR